MRWTLPMLFALACSGGNTELEPCTDCDAIGESTRFARLTHRQYDMSVMSLLESYPEVAYSERFISDTLTEGGFNNDAGQLQVGGDLWSDYQRAAESIAQSVVTDRRLYSTVVPEDPRGGANGVDYERRVEAESSEATSAVGRATSNGWLLWGRGGISTTLGLPEAGDYVFSTRVWADQAGPDLAEMELRIDGQVVTDVRVEAADESVAEIVEIELPLEAGNHEFTVFFKNDYYENGEDRNLYVDWLDVRGAAPAYDGPLPGEDEAKAFIERFGARVHRRPLTDDQVEAYLGLYTAGSALSFTDDPFKDGIYTVVMGMLQSPWFVYRTEISTEQDDVGRIPLDGWDLASKLSYALTHAPPDAQLRAAVEDGSLLTDAGYNEQVDRLLQTYLADDVLDDFHAQLLLVDVYENIYKDARLFPDWSPSMSTSMRGEALAFTRSVVREDGGIRDFFTDPRTFVDREIAPIYGLEVDSDTLVPVELDVAERAGVLTLSGFLAAQAHANEIDSIHRGAFVNLQFLCSNLPPPPDVIPPLPEPVVGQTNRQRVDAHTGEGTCGTGCHSALINPVGFAFENYDPVGSWRELDVGEPIDASGTFEFDGEMKSWETPVEFAALLSESGNAHTCLVRNWMRYLHGREPTEQDEVVIGDVADASVRQDIAIAEVLKQLVTDNSFRFRAPEVSQ